jgi:hypothetical protein
MDLLIPLDGITGQPHQNTNVVGAGSARHYNKIFPVICSIIRQMGRIINFSIVKLIQVIHYWVGATLASPWIIARNRSPQGDRDLRFASRIDKGKTYFCKQ